ncbi:MAG TPA: isoprenylcysteine carboxylmethyltransferase family protein [Acidimicrobiales bacterium]|nr:isoprenylcysteine carboxylmethyltransferase family protein [Acidimicrobiales bacterium]
MPAVFFIRTSVLWGVLFWSAVIVRFAVEAANATREPTGEAVVADRDSRRVLGRTFLIAGIAGFWLAFRLPKLAMPGPGRAYIVVGVVVMWLGFALRQWAVRTLGRFFTFELSVQTDQRVVENGPYRVVRHPSYSGLLLSWLGTAIALGNWLSLALLTIPYAIALIHRIRVEEGLLRQGLGPDYERYAASRKRLVPGVW